MIVDDDMFNVILIERIFKKNNLAKELIIESNGKKAIDRITNHLNSKIPLPDLLFLDINMPVMGGLQFLKELKQLNIQPFSINIFIMLTTDLNENHGFSEYSELIKGFINKPLLLESIKDIINNINK